MAKSKKHYFYVLHCKDDTLYGGYTTDLDRRLEEHNSGKGAKYTRLASRRPAQMVYAECFATRSQATAMEYAFKKQTRPDKEIYLENQGVDLHASAASRVVRDRRDETDENSEKL